MKIPSTNASLKCETSCRLIDMQRNDIQVIQFSDCINCDGVCVNSVVARNIRATIGENKTQNPKWRKPSPIFSASFPSFHSVELESVKLAKPQARKRETELSKTHMSFAASRVFKGCRALLAPAKSSAATTTTTASKPKATKTAAAKQKPNLAKPLKPKGILKVTPVSPALRDFLGVPESSRTDAVKNIWTYIKHHNLQVFHLISFSVFIYLFCVKPLYYIWFTH